MTLQQFLDFLNDVGIVNGSKDAQIIELRLEDNDTNQYNVNSVHFVKSVDLSDEDVTPVWTLVLRL